MYPNDEDVAPLLWPLTMFKETLEDNTKTFPFLSELLFCCEVGCFLPVLVALETRPKDSIQRHSSLRPLEGSKRPLQSSFAAFSLWFCWDVYRNIRGRIWFSFLFQHLHFCDGKKWNPTGSGCFSRIRHRESLSR